MNIETVQIHQENRSVHSSCYVARRPRLATVTGVRLLGEGKIAATHLVGQSIHLFKFPLNGLRARQIFVGDTVYEGLPAITDLLDFDGEERLLTSNFDACSGSLYKLRGEIIEHYRDIPLPNDSGRVHGARFYNANTVCLTTEKCRMYFLNRADGKVIAKFDCPFHLKDIYFIDHHTALAPFATSCPKSSRGRNYASGLILMSFDLDNAVLKITDMVFLWPCAFDAICRDPNSGNYFVTDQNGDRIVVAGVENDRILIRGEIGGFNFPHGIDTDGNIMVVTNYGDSTLSIFRNSDIQLSKYSGYFSRTSGNPPGSIQKLAARFICTSRRLLHVG